MSAKLHQEEALREIDELIQSMEDCREAFGSSMARHITIKIDRLESEKRWIRAHSYSDTLVAN
jgi:hypothetical protein